MLIEGVYGVGPRGIGRRGEDVGFAADFDDVGSMSATGTFGVKSVNRPALERRDSRLNKARLVQSIGMNCHLGVRFFGDRETVVYGCRRGSPIFMQLQPQRPCCNLLSQRFWLAGIAFAKKTEVDRVTVGSLKHSLNVPRARGAGRGESTMGRTGA